MAKPRVFVSSTYYDLKHIRNSLEAFIKSLGYESILFESGDIPFHHEVPLDISCYEEIKSAHIFVLIIGGRYGSPSSEVIDVDIDDKLNFYNSITKKEYEKAREKNIPIYIFVEKNVLAEYYTYKKNRHNTNIEYAHVDNINIFKLIDEIYTQKRNNLLKDFENFDDISIWLRDQWAGIFADCLSKKSEKSELSDLSSQINDLRGVSSVLREYSETIIRKIQPDNFEDIINEQHKKLRDKRIKRFNQNLMIDYLRDHSPKGTGDVKLYNSFIESKNVEEFLELAGFDTEYIKKFMEQHKKEALEDYNDLKEEFSKI